MSDRITRRDIALLFAGVIAGEAGAGVYDILKSSSTNPLVIAVSAISAMLATLLIMIGTMAIFLRGKSQQNPTRESTASNHATTGQH